MAPIYTYTCEHCKHSQDELFSMKNRPDFVSCNQCNRVAKHELAAGHFEVNGANAANRYSGESNFKWRGIPGSEE